MRISDWSSDVCSSDLGVRDHLVFAREAEQRRDRTEGLLVADRHRRSDLAQHGWVVKKRPGRRSPSAEQHRGALRDRIAYMFLDLGHRVYVDPRTDSPAPVTPVNEIRRAARRTQMYH